MTSRRELIAIQRSSISAQRRRKNMLQLVGYALVTWLFLSYALMLLVGAVHGYWWHFIPTMGYGAAVVISFITLIIGIVVGLITEAIERIG